MRIAVTGAKGFIGSATCSTLRADGHDVVEIDRSTGTNILGPELKDALAGCDGVIHLAGVLGTAELFSNVELAIDVNVKGAVRVLDVCKELGMKYVGITMPRVWSNVYQATKTCQAILASAWHQNFSVPVSHVRAFNAFGHGQHILHVQKIIPTFSYNAWNNLPIPIWGDGTQTVDLVYVRDVAQMLVDALQFGDDEVFDAGSGTAMTVNDVANLVLNMTGSDAGIKYMPMRPGETPVDIVARGEGWDKLGWSPEFNEEDLFNTVMWYRGRQPF